MLHHPGVIAIVPEFDDRVKKVGKHLQEERGSCLLFNWFVYHVGHGCEGGLVVDDDDGDDDGFISEIKFFEVPCPLAGGRAAEHHGNLHPNDYATLTATRLNKKILHLRI